MLSICLIVGSHLDQMEDVMSELIVVIPVIIFTVLMPMGIAIFLKRFLDQRESISLERE